MDTSANVQSAFLGTTARMMCARLSHARMVHPVLLSGQTHDPVHVNPDSLVNDVRLTSMNARRLPVKTQEHARME